MTTSAAFWDKIAPKYAQTDIADMAGYRATLDRTIHHLSDSDRVLELGCGTASTALEIAPHVAHVTGTDISPKMIAIGQEKLREGGLTNVTLKTATAGADSVAEGAPYTAVLALNLLHLLDNQKAALAQAHAVLAPGGLLISKTPCLGERWFFKPMIAVMRAFGKAPFVVSQRLDELRHAITAAGFEVVEDVVQSGTPARLYLVARKAQ